RFPPDARGFPTMSANTTFPVIELTREEVKHLPRTRPRRRPVGAELIAPGRTRFRVWAPARQRVDVVIEGGTAVELARESNGYFSVQAAGAAGARYRSRLGEERLYPDPASRFQPRGPHGPSEVIDPTTFRWTDQAWKGISPRGRVIYEMHVGTFTTEGTWRA